MSAATVCCAHFHIFLTLSRVRITSLLWTPLDDWSFTATSLVHSLVGELELDLSGYLLPRLFHHFSSLSLISHQVFNLIFVHRQMSVSKHY
jgi:hypothetical protein